MATTIYLCVGCGEARSEEDLNECEDCGEWLCDSCVDDGDGLCPECDAKATEET